MRNLILIALFAVACGDEPSPPPYTWGDASLSIAVAYCDANYFCGASFGQVDDWYSRCERHVVFHLCELDETCDTPLLDEDEATVQACFDALHGPTFQDPASEDCYLLTFLGQVPEACRTALDLNPTEP